MLGGEVCVWGEYIVNEDVLVKMWYVLFLIKIIICVILEKKLYLYIFW